MPQITNFFHLPMTDRLLVLETFMLLGLARGAVLFIPFRWLASARKIAVNENKSTSLTPQIKRVGWAIRRISCYTPWRSNCLAKAIAGRYMLRRRRIASTIYFGMIKNTDGQFAAHAWLESGNTVLTGGSNLNRYTIVAKFADYR